MSERSVANLTTEQLYRKRAFDRENQRASRARKKNRIAELEDEVSDLKRRLAHSEEQVKRLQTSESGLREVIDSARSSLQMIDAAATSQFVVPSPPSSGSTSGSVNDDYAPVVQGATSPSLSFDSGHDQNSAMMTTAFYDESQSKQGLSSTDNTSSLALTDENAGITFGFPFSDDFDNMFHVWEQQFPMSLTATNAFSVSFPGPFLPETNENSWAFPTVGMDLPSLPDRQLIRPWERVPLHLDASCRLDTVLLELARSTRQQVQASGQIPELSSPAFPSIGSLLNPEQQNSHSPISNAIGVHGRITMEIPSLPGKIAMMYNMCVYLRWLITPNKRNYEALPEYLRPLESQLTIPHPVWIDMIVWPEAREGIMRNMDWSEFEIFRAIANKCISINWPHGQSSVFTALSKSKTGLRLNPLFESHIRQLRNWTMGSAVSDRFPFLKCVPTTIDEYDAMQAALFMHL